MEGAEGRLDVTEGAGMEEAEGPMTGGGVDLEVDGDRVTGGQDDDVITVCFSLISHCCRECLFECFLYRCTN